MHLPRCWPALLLAAGVCACTPPGEPGVDEAAAREFIAGAEARLLELWIAAGRADWVRSTYITGETNALAAAANAELMAATTELSAAAARFDSPDLPPDLARKLNLLKTSLSAVAPSEPALQRELAGIVTEMEGLYGRGTYCPAGADECLDLTAMERLFASSRDTDELLETWTGWREVAQPIRPLYERFVELSNAGARELGFDDLGALWRARYEMPPGALAAELERLWLQVRPLYEALHCHVRAELGAELGTAVVPQDGPIPAHLLGNMWGQGWTNVYETVAPRSRGRGYDLTRLLQRARVDEVGMVRYGERFFSSLGFEPLPATFWERSLFVKPADRDVVCHASAWNLDFESDVRIKMCIGVNDEDFVTIHHELGHNYYQRAYSGQDPLYRNSANDGFHEGIGDTIALSITPEYLVRAGLLNRAPGADGDIGLLLRRALDKVAFPAVRAAGRPVALAGVLRRGSAEPLQRRLVGAAGALPGTAPGAAPQRGAVRPRRQVPRAGQHAVHALLRRPHPAVPVPPGAVRRGGVQRPAAPLLDLRERGGRPPAAHDAGDGREPPLAGGPGDHSRHPRDGRHGHPRLLRPPGGLARRAERRPHLRLVTDCYVGRHGAPCRLKHVDAWRARHPPDAQRGACGVAR